MQLTTPSDRIRLKRYRVGEAWKGHAPSKPPYQDPSDYPNVVSIPTGLAFQTRDGLAYTLRRVTPADVELLDEFMRRPSEKTRWLRFMTARPCSPEFVRAEAAVAELVYTRESGTGEVGVVVMDDAQRKGIGSLLLQQQLLIAQEIGLTHLHGDMFAENYAIQRLIKALQLPYTATIQSGEMQITVRVPE